MNYALGIDIGSSSVKIAIVDSKNGQFIASAQYPKSEMPMLSKEKSWAEQDPEMWWSAFLECLNEIRSSEEKLLEKIELIGISYQMHGLVCVDEKKNVLRPSIIWCDSRAVEIGAKALDNLGEEYCLGSLLNSPGNFTASKLKWVKENEPEIYHQIHKIMLPGDYISMKLSGIVNSTISGLSEGVFWDFNRQKVSNELLGEYGFDPELIPDYQISFKKHAVISDEIAERLGLKKGAIITYKAGDQPNNALSLNVLEPGEIAATAGTSGVVYGVVDTLFVDEKQRVNSFAHVNYTKDSLRIGVLLCINGVGISNAWIKNNFGFADYLEMNSAASEVEPGAEGLLMYPFGNGSERMLANAKIDASIEGLNYHIHEGRHFARAVQEGIAYSFAFGMEAFEEKNITIKKLKAGNANMFLSDLFCQILADLIGVDIELYNTDGAVGAARGAMIGNGANKKDAFSTLIKTKTYFPISDSPYRNLYGEWKQTLTKKITKE